MLPTGAVVSLAIVVPWYVFVYREYGWQYIQSFVLGENLGRYAEAVGEQARGAFFYLPSCWRISFRGRSSFSARTVVGIPSSIGPRRAALPDLGGGDRRVLFLSGTKEDLYILPIVPAEAALIGAMTAAWRADERWPALWTLLEPASCSC